MTLHFENLWEEAELLLKNDTMISSWEELIRAMGMKLSIIEKIENTALSKEEQDKIKGRFMGKLLLDFTQLSYKGNINVFAALQEAINDRKISIFEEKYK